MSAKATALGGAVLVNASSIPDTGSISTTSVATLSGPVSAKVLCANVTTVGFPGKSTASASVADAKVAAIGIPTITMRVIKSTSTTTCGGSSGTTTIGYLAVGRVVVISVPTTVAPNTTINVGVVKLVLNEQIAFSTPDRGLTVNAVHATVNALGPGSQGERDRRVIRERHRQLPVARSRPDRLHRRPGARWGQDRPAGPSWSQDLRLSDRLGPMLLLVAQTRELRLRVQIVYARYPCAVSVPVTTRFDPSVVEALDRAVAAGLAPNRGSIVSAAVRAWLANHGEEAIVASYRRRYVDEDPARNELVGQLAAFSVAGCLAANED